MTSALLVLVSMAIVALFYTWATASTTQVSSAIYTDAAAAEQRILASVAILTPPPINIWDSNQPVIIHNNGSVPIVNVRVIYTKPGDPTPIAPSGKLIDVDGNVFDINSTDWPLEALSPGEAIIFWLPADSSYSGYTITVIGLKFEKSVTIGVAE